MISGIFFNLVRYICPHALTKKNRILAAETFFIGSTSPRRNGDEMDVNAAPFTMPTRDLNFADSAASGPDAASSHNAGHNCECSSFNSNHSNTHFYLSVTSSHSPLLPAFSTRSPVRRIASLRGCRRYSALLPTMSLQSPPSTQRRSRQISTRVTERQTNCRNLPQPSDIGSPPPMILFVSPPSSPKSTVHFTEVMDVDSVAATSPPPFILFDSPPDWLLLRPFFQTILLRVPCLRH